MKMWQFTSISEELKYQILPINLNIHLHTNFRIVYVIQQGQTEILIYFKSVKYLY